MLDFLQSLFDSHYYSLLHHALIVIHVLAALVALVVAPVAMIVQKGGDTHRRWGRVYCYAMFMTNILALWLLFWRFNAFLFGVTIISLYGALTGYRVLYRKQSHVRWFDWALSSLVLTIGIGLIAWGALTGLGLTAQFLPSSGNMPGLVAILSLVFGLSITHDAWNDLRLFRSPSPDRHWWWYYHMERILGSYIALSTALMVQQVGPRLPESIAWLAWVAPTAIGTPLLVRWIGHYRRKFATGARAISTEPILPAKPTLSAQ
jgi:uncharacterized membrane protein